MSLLESNFRRVAAENADASWRPSRVAAEAAVRTLIAWAGADPNREGLSDTPARVVRAYEEMFGGYRQDPVDLLSRTFNETDGYDEPIVLTGIRFVSHCEHHLSPIVGRSEEHTSELQSLMRISYAVFCLKKKTKL